MSLNDLPSIKIILLGDSGVGKSSIIKRYLEDKFDQNIAVTFGSNFLEKVLTIKGKKVKIELWDTAGQEEFRSVTKIFIKNSKIVVLVYNVTLRQNFENLNYWYDFIHKEIGQNIIYGLAGNKTDLILEEGYKEEVPSEEAKEYAKKINATFSLISAKESANEIIQLFEQLVTRYIESDYFKDELNSNIKLDNNNNGSNTNKNECCLGNNKKNFKLKMIFLGCNGVGKTSIIKTIKGNLNINNLGHTKKIIKEEIIYTKNGHKITVQLKDTNGDDCKDEIFNKAIEKCKVFFLVFDIYKKETLYKLEDWLKLIDTKENKVYILGYNNDTFESIGNDCSNEVEKFTSKYKCEYEAVSIEDIYKVKSIILDNISMYMGSLGY